MFSRRVMALTITAIAVAGLSVLFAQGASARHARYDGDASGGAATNTPIKHVVVIFQENVSFDHYFATYPYTHPADGDQPFSARADTPTVNGLNTPLQSNANPSDPYNRAEGSNNQNSAQPFLLHRSQAYTCDQDHDYTPEQQAFDHGLMDMFPEFTGSAGGNPGCDYGRGKGIVMGYYDGGTVTALWNYAQRFAMSDNSYETTFGPSTVGALNLISGNTHGVVMAANPSSPEAGDVAPGTGTVIGDPQPLGDVCDTRESVRMSGHNIGDLLNVKHITWGWFEGGFHKPGTIGSSTPQPDCKRSHTGANGRPKLDYIPHHEPFQYYTGTANLAHYPPSSVMAIGHTDQANHQYDLSDFWSALDAGNLPAVSFLKAPGYQDGHADYSSPVLEQQFLVETINRLERSPEWKSTAVIINYDDSDGWYDHQMGPIVNHSQSAADALSDPGLCGQKAPMGGYEARCGYGPRLPLLVISPYAKANFVDSTTTDQTSIIRFIEDNWQTGRIGDSSFDSKAGSLENMFSFDHGNGEAGNGHRLFLDPVTGQPVPPGWAQTGSVQ